MGIERERDSKTVDEARTDLEWSRYMASANAVLAGAPIQIVSNPDGDQRRAGEDLLALIQNRTLQKISSTNFLKLLVRLSSNKLIPPLLPLCLLVDGLFFS